jgi:serine/threonine protein kinase
MPRREPRHDRQHAPGEGPRRDCSNVGSEPRPLSAGTRVGPYEIVGAIGAGGMGEVYRARDTKLGRDVALKILPDAFAADPDRLALCQERERAGGSGGTENGH